MQSSVQTTADGGSESDAKTRDFIVRQLEQFLQEGREINKQPVITSRSADSNFRREVENFLERNLSESEVKRFQQGNVGTLKEIIKEVLGGSAESFSSQPKLAGRIDCLDHDIAWDLEHYGLDQAMPLKLKVTFALNVTLWNETSAGTTVSGFSLWLLWQNGQYQADALPVEDHAVQRSYPRSEPLEWGYEVRSEPLVAFANNVEITNRNHANGWLRFLARDTPSEAGDNAVLRRDVTWKLYAHDRKGHAHKIYEGTWDLPPGGSIERLRTVY